VVVTSVLTSVLAPIGLRWVFAGRGDEEESPGEARLVFRRALLPVRVRGVAGEGTRALEAAALTAVCEPGSRVTVLSVVDDGGASAADEYVKEVSGLFPSTLSVRRRVIKGDPVGVILDVAARGYDLLAVGAPEPGPGDEFLFGPVIDDLVRLAPCPTMVFTARGESWPPRTIMVPTGGGAAAARAAEVAYALAGPDSTVLLFHVVDPELATEMGVGRQSSAAVRMGIGQDIVNDLRQEGERAGVRVASEIVMGGQMTTNIIERTRRGVDLIVLGTSVRTGTQRLFLGPRVERLIKESPCSTLILNV
jgi:nucleotide-binding universal stress UspA family protein